MNTASEAGHFAGDGYGVYNTSKFAVVGLTESLARDLRNTKIGVSMLCPGQVETGIFTNTHRPEDYQKDDEDAPMTVGLPRTLWSLMMWRLRSWQESRPVPCMSLVMKTRRACSSTSETTVL